MKRIDVLPDDVLLEIFDFYLDGPPSFPQKTSIEAWQLLVHVCRRWRSLVFGSPRRLNLQLCCTSQTPTRDTLDIWPALPLIVEGIMASTSNTDSIIPALEQSNRIREVSLLNITGWQFEEVLPAMQVPFPELTELQLFVLRETSPVLVNIPDSFLGGSAPRLRNIALCGIPYPGLPKLLLSATNLLELDLFGIREAEYISPEAIVALISELPSLEILLLVFETPESPSGEIQIRPPQRRAILPALHDFRFDGATGYLEDLLNRIDTPQLHKMEISFFSQIDFDCPQLVQFIDRSPALRASDEAHVEFGEESTGVALLALPRSLYIEISCVELYRQLSSVAQICNSSFPPISTVEDLYIERQVHTSPLVWKNDGIETTLWSQFLLPFSAVKNLYISKEFAPGIADAIPQLVADRTDLLPHLQNIFVEGRGPSSTSIASRQLSDHPIAISVWDRF